VHRQRLLRCYRIEQITMTPDLLFPGVM